MITVERFSCNDFDSDYTLTSFYRDGVLIARKYNNEPIKLLPSLDDGIELSRAQGFRYWEKYFPTYYNWMLPKPIYEATQKPAIYRKVVGDWVYIG